MTVCVKCGLPADLCVCESIAKETQKIRVAVEQRKFHKKYTTVRGIDEKEINLVALGKELKAKLACGGTVKDNTIELQGDHKLRVKALLLQMGFAPETIVVE